MGKVKFRLVDRGGSWSDHKILSRIGYRDNYEGKAKSNELGFRIIRMVSGLHRIAECEEPKVIRLRSQTK